MNEHTNGTTPDLSSPAPELGRWMGPEALALAASPQGLNDAELAQAAALRDVPGWGALDGAGRGDETLACAWAARERVFAGGNDHWIQVDLAGGQLIIPRSEGGQGVSARQEAAHSASRHLLWWLRGLSRCEVQVWTAPGTEHWERTLQPLLLRAPGQEATLAILVTDTECGEPFAALQVAGQDATISHGLDFECCCIAQSYGERLARGEVPAPGSPEEQAEPINEDGETEPSLAWERALWERLQHPQYNVTLGSPLDTLAGLRQASGQLELPAPPSGPLGGAALAALLDEAHAQLRAAAQP